MPPSLDAASLALEFVETVDGARIAIKRRPSPGRTPVILFHGLAVNADIWDLPDIHGPDFHFRSLASVLHEAGFDLWLANFRGHGAPHMLSAPPPGQRDWCVDHLLLYDLPAVIRHVSQATGRPPFLFGNSMGAMILAAHLCGASEEATLAGPRVRIDADAARERGAAIRGCVLVEFPAALRWPESLYRPDGRMNWATLRREWRRTDERVNYPFELAARSAWLQAGLRAIGEFRLDWLRPRLDGDLLRGQSRPRQRWIYRVKCRAMRFFSEQIKGSQNFEPELFLDGLLRAVDHVKAGVLDQLGLGVRLGSFVSALGAPPVHYPDHYPNFAAPILLVLGGRDRIANAAVTREVFFDRIASFDRALHLCEDIAHGEFAYCMAACRSVYPDILSWLRTRDAAPSAR